MAQIRYMVDDVEASITVYRDLLGFELVEQIGPAMSILRRGDLARRGQARARRLESLRARSR